MLINNFLGLVAIVALAGCAGVSVPASSSATAEEEAPRGIVGEWRVSSPDSIHTCRLVAKKGSTASSGPATDFGCIGLDQFFQVSRWERKKGAVKFYSFRQDEALATVYRDDRDQWSGELIPSGDEIVLKRY
ncbi:MAG: AprI/Inh family metalloprotease inhibitor [Pseudomonadota bacterium]